MADARSAEPARRLAIAAALLVVEYLVVSFLFDARELVPDSLRAIGDLAPMPVIAGVAVLILRASRPSLVGARAAPRAPSRTTVASLLGAHVAAFAAFLALSFRMRASAMDDVPLSTSLLWTALLALAVALLAAFALARANLAAVARDAAAPVGVAVLVGVAAWGAGLGTGQLWHPLARLTLYPVGTLVEIFSDDLVVDVDRFVVGVERFKIRIDPVCSGYEGMGLVAVLIGAYVLTFRGSLRWPHAAALVLIAVAGAFVANVVRITALIYVGALGAPDVAVSGFHSKAGWLLFCGVALGTTWLARARVFRLAAASEEDDDARAPPDNPTARYVLPLLALVAGSLVTGLASSGAPNHLEIVALAAAACALVWSRRTVRETWSTPSNRRSDALAIAAGALVFIAWLALDDVAGRDGRATEPGPLAAALDAWSLPLAALWIATRLVASVAVVPLVEELAFRGFLLRRIAAADFAALRYREVSALAVVASSVAFGALHERWLAGTLAGLVYAVVVWRTGRLRDAVVAHVVTNALIAVAVLAFGRWALWT